MLSLFYPPIICYEYEVVERYPLGVYECPAVDQSGWAAFAKGSVNGSRYTTIDTAMTFYAGQERCQQLGGHLVHVNTLREQLFLEDFLRQMLQAVDQHGSFLHLLRRACQAVRFCARFNVFLYFFSYYRATHM